jgi:hypothetical protein
MTIHRRYGGRLLWLWDGSLLQEEQRKETGRTVSLPEGQSFRGEDWSSLHSHSGQRILTAAAVETGLFIELMSLEIRDDGKKGGTRV